MAKLGRWVTHKGDDGLSEGDGWLREGDEWLREGDGWLRRRWVAKKEMGG